MRETSKILSPVILAVALLGCGGGDDGGGDDAADTGSTGMMSADDDGGTNTTPGTTNPTTGMTSTPPMDTGDDTAGDTADDTAGDTGMPAGYDFDDTPPDQMTQVDRMGMPAVNTAVITSKDDYNESSPVDDAAGTFVDEIVASLEGLHAALDDDLTGAGLVPCAVKTCVAQGAPLIVPDVIHIDPSMAAGFPNGRLPTDPVIDVTLAVILLDLSTGGQNALTLVGLPLNPTENDVPFESDFPFLAAPH
jgi:hypothetical protein